MVHLLNNKKLLGVSLLEVVAVLLLSSVVLVVAARMTTSLLYQIKVSEVEDYVTGLVIRTLEIAKAPTSVLVDTLPTASGTYYKFDPNTSVLNLVAYGAAPNITSCNSSSSYFMNSSDVNNFKQVPVCIQFVVRRLTNPHSGAYYYDIAIRAVYELPGRVDTLNVQGYRYADFETTYTPPGGGGPLPCELTFPPTC